LKWGYTVTASHRNQAAWFKLLLSEEAREKGGARVEETRRLLRKLGKTSVDVVADYLSCLWQHAIGAIELALTKIAVDNMTFRVVLTLPANWDPNAIDLTKKAAIQAGITAARSRGPTIFRTVSEPEAAALAAFKESGMRWRPDFQVGTPISNRHWRPIADSVILPVRRHVRSLRRGRWHSCKSSWKIIIFAFRRLSSI
jgi:hypothetical protein